MRKVMCLLILLALVILFSCPSDALCQTAEVVETISNPDVKMDGVAWDGKNIWIITYQSSPIEWRIARIDKQGKIIDSFIVPVSSLDDIHNFGMSNITSDGKTIWANHWNEGFIYQFSKNGKVIKKFGVSSVNQLIPVGIAWDGKYLWVLHWSDRNLYKLDTRGREIEKVSLRKLFPQPDMGLAWDGKHLWVGSKGANCITRITTRGEVTGSIKGPKPGGGIRDLAWDGKHLLVVYQQGSTIYKLKITE